MGELTMVLICATIHAWQALESSPAMIETFTPRNQLAAPYSTHILWKIEQGHIPKVAVVGLLTTGTSIQSALNAAGLGSLDVTAHGVLALPLYAFSDVQIERVWEKLPLV